TPRARAAAHTQGRAEVGCAGLFRELLGSGEPEAHAAHRVYEARGRGVVAELAPQPAHASVERLGRPEPVLVPDLGHQRLAANHAARALDQGRQQVELLAAQLELVAVQRHAPGATVHLQLAHTDHALLAAVRPARATQHRADAGDHLGPAEGLDHVVVRAQLEPDD